MCRDSGDRPSASGAKQVRKGVRSMLMSENFISVRVYTVRQRLSARTSCERPAMATSALSARMRSSASRVLRKVLPLRQSTASNLRTVLQPAIISRVPIW